MKYLKMFGLAVVATAGLMAFVGAGTASATVVCASTLTPCGVEAPAVRATLIGSMTLENGSTVLTTCTESKLKWKIEAQGANQSASGKVEELVWGSCTRTTNTVKLGKLTLHQITGTENGTLTAQETEITINGIFGSSCTYGAGTGIDLGLFEAGVPANIVIDGKLIKTAGGFTCPLEATMTALYSVTEPAPAAYIEPS